jgi:hypothetical protein
MPLDLDPRIKVQVSSEHDLFRASFARRSGLREGGKPGSVFGIMLCEQVN